MTAAHPPSAKTYVVIWGWLAGLMLASVLLSGAPITARTVAWMVFGLSTIKAGLVALYYMHLKFDRQWLWVVVGFPLVLIALAAGIVLSSHLVKL
ncbi:MAG TPA: hypothetical protein DDX89_00300 [Candidatus Omnitrophica bacterium]|nr:MAG: hypothetical protein A2105_04795 [Omnitrophica WOR_2 bacterium GWF2_63_9]OGX45863.1 MAG: hypothetical protein A3I71_02205 [Omnitrophica WOR_2 bacterium RIFCSPLOWO2_02_FULL_63_16]OGX47669.1 MAG: hypothetical protein A3G88_00995 [Omnitrophica WOR_2 bacterium RIFCSPLOWO2_12_FULL_63_16]HAM41026.1 hypothetical protein [Candidatus Omnitrophota bacterium]HBH96221.1 hypothetical protein [Candidatus Omnitrophota bacterium]